MNSAGSSKIAQTLRVAIRQVQQQRDVTSVADYQAGLIARRQLLQLGWTDAQIKAQLAAGRWHRVNRAVYSTFTGELNRQCQLWVVHLVAGDESAIAGESALVALGLQRRERADVAVCVPHSLRRRFPTMDLQVLRRRQMPPVVERYRMPPIVRADYALLQAVEELSTPASVIELTSAAMQQRIVSPDALSKALERTSRQRHRALLSKLLTQFRDGSESPLEADGTQKVLGAHGLPAGKGQVVSRLRGRKVIHDRVLEPYPVILEFDGRLGHEDSEGRFHDRRRDGAAYQQGFKTVRLGWYEVHEFACESALEVAAELFPHGWQGPIKACSATCRAVRN